MLNPNVSFVTYEDLVASIRGGLSRIPRDIDLIVGIPRSGMIPAYVIGLFLNLPVVDIGSFLENRNCGHGTTRNLKHNIPEPLSAKKILLIDDSYYSGNSILSSLKKARAVFKGEILTCAAITTPEGKGRLNIYFMVSEIPRVFEWNVFHHDIINNSCLDFDGVLCVDPTEEENDDGSKYRAFLRTAKPLYLPTQEIGYIVSSRLEKYREETEYWLKEHGIKYRNLCLLNLDSKEERIQTQAHHKHKIKVYQSTSTALFIESSFEQAELIAKETGKPVLCTENMKIYSGQGVHIGAAYVLAAQKKNLFVYLLRTYLFSQIPPKLKKRIKGVLRRL